MKILLYVIFGGSFAFGTVLGADRHTIYDLQQQVIKLESINKHSESDVDFGEMSLLELANYRI